MSREQFVSKKYSDMLRLKHQQLKKKNGGGWGGAVQGKVLIIDRYIKLTDSKSVLDYGSGSGAFRRDLEQLRGDADIHEYEPGHEELSAEPPVCDATVCIDVMEHVEPELVDNVLQEIYDKTRKFAYIGVCCVPSGGAFDDGTNLHLLVKPPVWWIHKLEEYPWEIINLNVANNKHIQIIVKKK